jgi:sulfur carrier protein
MNAMIVVNGTSEPLAAATVTELLREKDIAGRRGVAVAVNGSVVARRAWAETRLKPGDKVEIVHARQGG